MQGAGSRPPCGGADRNMHAALLAWPSLPSPPVRGRGSKHKLVGINGHGSLVAPRAGARIETATMRSGLCTAMVAPRAGARIETLHACNVVNGQQSPPVRGRGSKLFAVGPSQHSGLSPPVRGRGSKHRGRRYASAGRGRPPCGGADRNASSQTAFSRLMVAPRAGARIETSVMTRSYKAGLSPPVRGRGSKPLGIGAGAAHHTSPPVRGRGSKHYGFRAVHSGQGSPPVRGRGSKPARPNLLV